MGLNVCEKLGCDMVAAMLGWPSWHCIYSITSMLQLELRLVVLG
jgi:hypothetical protein